MVDAAGPDVFATSHSVPQRVACSALPWSCPQNQTGDAERSPSSVAIARYVG